MNRPERFVIPPEIYTNQNQRTTSDEHKTVALIRSEKLSKTKRTLTILPWCILALACIWFLVETLPAFSLFD